MRSCVFNYDLNTLQLAVRRYHLRQKRFVFANFCTQMCCLLLDVFGGAFEFFVAAQVDHEVMENLLLVFKSYVGRFWQALRI